MAKPLTSRNTTRTRRRRPSLRSLLVVLVVASVVPIFLFSAWLVVLQSRREMTAVQEKLLDTAQAVAIDVDREVVSTIQSVQALALDFDLNQARGREFESLSNRMLSAQRSWETVIVRDPSGKPLVTVTRRAGETPSRESQSDENQDILRAEQFGALDAPMAFLLGSSVGVHVPIRIDRKIAYLASVFLDPKIFTGLLSKHKVSSDWLVSILDPKKIVVASTRSAEKFFGKPTQLLRQSSGHSAPGELFRSKVEDTPSYVILSTAPVSGWSVALAAPAKEVEAPYYRMVWLIVGIGLLCLSGGITIAYMIARKAARPFERLAADARDRAQGKSGNTSQGGSLAEVESINQAFDHSALLLKERAHERDYFRDELDVRLRDLAGLHKLTTSLLAIEERQALFNEIVAGALSLLKTDKGSLHLADQTTQRADLVGQIGFSNGFAESFSAPACVVIDTRRPVVIEDIENNSQVDDQQREAAREIAVRAALAFPLTARGGDIIGALATYFSQPFKPSQWQEILMDLYARYCVNIIQQKQAREELRIYTNRLEERVKDHAKKLEDAYFQRINDLTKQKELEKGLREAQKMELVGNLAGGVAHDFNNILNIILSYASTLDSKNEKELAKHVQMIQETVKRGSAVVRQLLAVARKSEAKFEPTDLNTLVRRLIELLAQTFPKGIVIAAEFDPLIPLVMLDSNQISQAVINLCINARDAMPNGGKLTIKTRYLDTIAARQQFAGTKEVAHGYVVVSDTGAGIQEGAKEHLFEPFFTTKEPNRGTGLGLSVAYGIMQAHDGFIHFDSMPGRGTSFYLCFPIREATALVESEVESSKIGVSSPTKSATILLVEDEPNQVTLLRQVFEKEGYAVLTAADGYTALDIFSDHRDLISAVLLDLGLPGINGWEVFQKMREIDPQVKVVFATGYVPPEFDMERVQKDSCAVVMKPYVVGEVLKQITAAVFGQPSR